MVQKPIRIFCINMISSQIKAHPLSETEVYIHRIHRMIKILPMVHYPKCETTFQYYE